jgi:hypothetical protein
MLFPPPTAAPDDNRRKRALKPKMIRVKNWSPVNSPNLFTAKIIEDHGKNKFADLVNDEDDDNDDDEQAIQMGRSVQPLAGTLPQLASRAGIGQSRAGASRAGIGQSRAGQNKELSIDQNDYDKQSRASSK